MTRCVFLLPGDIAGIGRSDGELYFESASADWSVDEAPKLSTENSGP